MMANDIYVFISIMAVTFGLIFSIGLAILVLIKIAKRWGISF